VPSIGPARLIVGAYETATSPVRVPRGINYLLITLKPGERWTYEPPAGHSVGWVAVGQGALSGNERLSNGELVIFEPGEAPITFEGAEGTGATFVLGSAVPHPYDLHLGAYSVHTSADALTAGERNLRELKAHLDASGDRRAGSGSTPVFRG
jgi:redox-sensitive bicupin YhaK (pirin superfamily)